jgi:hypothetical protein
MTDSDSTRRGSLKAIVPSVHHAARVLSASPDGSQVESLRMRALSKLLRVVADRIDEAATHGTRDEVQRLHEAWWQLRVG